MDKIRWPLAAGLSLETIFDAMPFYVMVVDEDYKILFVNNYALERYGIALQEISGQPCYRIMSAMGQPMERCPLKKSIEQDSIVNNEFFDERQDKWLRMISYPSEQLTSGGKRVVCILILDITNRKKTEAELLHSISRYSQLMGAMIQAVTKIIESKDPYTAIHQNQVADLSYLIAKEMGLSEIESRELRMEGSLHDVGKISIPTEILVKPVTLNNFEYEIVKAHTINGYEILKDIAFKAPVAEVALQHHERFDGSGYPNGLRGGEIIAEAKIVAVADVISAMSSHRPYRGSLSIEEIIDEIESNAGIKYDPDVAGAAVSMLKREGLSGEILPYETYLIFDED